jgi:ATP phosphoribosyltransferase
MTATANTDPVTIALPKGRLLEGAIALCAKIGLSHPELTPATRQLSFQVAGHAAQLVIVRDVDVPTYVEYGTADIGIVGKDRLLEQRPAVYEPLDLGFGLCRIVLAEPRVSRAQPARPARPARWTTRRVATKYPNITERYFLRKGLPVEIIKLSGTIELAPLMGLADQIVDIVDTGATLRAHHLVEVEELARSTARVIVNRASMKTKHHRVRQIIQQLAGQQLAGSVGG